jgi:hypothetical protein
MAGRKTMPKRQPQRTVPSSPAKKSVIKTGQRPYVPLRPYK